MKFPEISNQCLFIVTGATGGLGQSISEFILNNGGQILFVAKDSQKIELFENKIQAHLLNSFTKCLSNLGEAQGLFELKNVISKILDSTNEIKNVILINNASIIDPISLIEDISFDEIINALRINVASSFSLSSIIIGFRKLYKIDKTFIINISSGVSINPVIGWSSYCISKAALNMLTKCIVVENENKSQPIYSLSINPGPINTGMQQKIRAADSNLIPATKKFEKMFVEGKLQSPDEVVEKMFRILMEGNYSNGDFIDFNLIN